MAEKKDTKDSVQYSPYDAKCKSTARAKKN